MAFVSLIAILSLTGQPLHAQSGSDPTHARIDGEALVGTWLLKKPVRKQLDALLQIVHEISDLDPQNPALTDETRRRLSHHASRNWRNAELKKTSEAFRTLVANDPEVRRKLLTFVAANAANVNAVVRVGDRYLRHLEEMKDVWTKFMWAGGPAESGIVGTGLFVMSTMGGASIGGLASNLFWGNSCGFWLGAVPTGLTLAWKIPKTLLMSLGALNGRWQATKELRRLKKSLLSESPPARE